MTSWNILKLHLYNNFKSVLSEYICTLSKLSNDTKITQNGVQMRKLWAKQNGAAVQCENFTLGAKPKFLQKNRSSFLQGFELI